VSEKIMSLCPENGQKIVVYDTTKDNKTICGVARLRVGGGAFDYLDDNLVWQPSSLAQFKTMAEAEAHYQKYMIKALAKVIIPLGIDKGLCRIEFKCPHCDLRHKCAIGVNYWEDAPEFITKACPKKKEKVTVRLWTKKVEKHKDGDKIVHKLAAAERTVDPMPKWDCKECFASGEYIGFCKVEPCMTCFPPMKT
jgi:hypothetical protein